MENGKQYVHMNHFTLGEKRQPVKKTNTPLFQNIFLYLIFTMSFYFSIFQSAPSLPEFRV